MRTADVPSIWCCPHLRVLPVLDGEPPRIGAAMKRRIILCDFYWTRDKDPRVPLGHASLLAALHAADVADVRTVVVPVNAPPSSVKAIVAMILGHADGVDARHVDVAIGIYVWSEEVVQALILLLRARGFSGRIILGGPQVSYTGAGVDLLYPGADIFVRGYGEQALVELARTPDRVAITGVHYAGLPDRAEQATVDLTALPSPFLTGAIPLQGQRFVRWETQRGCPFRCAFCQHREAGARLVRSTLAEQRIFREIDQFCEAGVDDIAVLDPIFNAGPLAIPVLERLAERNYPGRISLQCRAEMTTPEFLDAAQNLNVQLEFGLQTIHEREGAAIRRHNNVPKVDAALRDVRRRGLPHEVSLIYGLPEQTLASFMQTVAWCLERQVPVIKAFPLLLLRGTELDRDRASWGLVEDGGAMPMVVASDTFSRTDFRAMARIAEALLQTEGHHPLEIGELLRTADGLEPREERWRPVGVGSTVTFASL